MANPKRIQGVISGTTEVGRHTRSSPPKRPTPDDFINMVYHPQDHKILISEYVGTDSKYTLAKKHAGMMIRSSVKSQDIAGRTREVAEPLSAIDTFLGSLLDYQALKPEQRGCVALRICFGALTALLGESSQGTSVETFVSDSHASVIPREHLSDFRSFNPDLHHILCELSSKLEKCINLYRHRRCPSSSLVAKFQEMSDTLELWNRHLMDDTFAVPSQIVSDWLKNHPTQVDSRRRNQAYSRRYSPDFSGINRPSPTQWDSNYLSPMSAYGEPSRPSKKYGVRSTSIDRSDQYDTLFKPSTGVTYFGSNRPAYASTSYNPKPYHTTDFAGGINLSQSMDEAWDTCLSRLSLQ